MPARRTLDGAIGNWARSKPDSKMESGSTCILSVAGLSLSNRQRVILIVYLCLDTISFFRFPRHQSRLICMQTKLLAVLHLDEIVPAFYAEQLALHHFGAFGGAALHLLVHLLVIIGL